MVARVRCFFIPEFIPDKIMDRILKSPDWRLGYGP